MSASLDVLNATVLVTSYKTANSIPAAPGVLKDIT